MTPTNTTKERKEAEIIARTAGVSADTILALKTKEQTQYTPYEVKCEMRAKEQEIHKLEQQRDELLAACKAMALVGTWGKSSPILAQAKAAIAKVEGRAQ